MFRRITATSCPTKSPEQWRRIFDRVSRAKEQAGIDDALPRFAEFVSKVYYDEFRAKRSNVPQGILLIGGIGCGKTKRIRFMADILDIPLVEADDVVMQIARHPNDDEYMRSVTRCANVNCINNRHYNDLIIDDLGTEQAEVVTYGTRRDIMRDIIMDRYEQFANHGRITHFTTNLEPEDIRSRYGDRIASRLTDMCVCIRMAGGDRRTEGRLAK